MNGLIKRANRREVKRERLGEKKEMIMRGGKDTDDKKKK